MNSILSMPKKIDQYYDRVAFDYRWFWNLKKSMAIRIGYWDRNTKKLSDALKREDEFLSHVAGIKSTDHVLDAGCGVGGSAVYLAKTYGCKVTGITLCRNQVFAARKNAEDNGVAHLIDIFFADFNDTGFQDGTFDVVWAVESLSHAKNKELALKELNRVLKEDGRLIGADYFSTQSVYSKKIDKIRKIILDGLHFYSFEFNRRFRDCLRKTGFNSIEYYDITQHALPSAKLFYKLSFIGITAGKILEVLGLRKSEQTQLAWATHYQYKALKNRIHEYRLFYSKKGSYGPNYFLSNGLGA